MDLTRPSMGGQQSASNTGGPPVQSLLPRPKSAFSKNYGKDPTLCLRLKNLSPESPASFPLALMLDSCPMAHTGGRETKGKGSAGGGEAHMRVGGFFPAPQPQLHTLCFGGQVDREGPNRHLE